MAALLCLGIAGCECKKVPAARGETAASASYSVLGVIRQLPDPERPGVPLLIHHQEIPDFVQADGERSPMPPMTMPFSVADGVSLAELAVGDPVAFTLEVDWQADAAMLITSISRAAPVAIPDPESGGT